MDPTERAARETKRAALPSDRREVLSLLEDANEVLVELNFALPVTTDMGAFLIGIAGLLRTARAAKGTP